MSQSNLSDALAYARLGWHVFPCNKGDKSPIVKMGFHAASTDPAQLEQWWTLNPDAAIGVACFKSGLFVIDLDVNHHVGQDGLMSWRMLCEEHGTDPEAFTLAARTSRGGRHILFRRPEVDKITTTNNIVPTSGIDVRGDGGYFIAPSTCEPQRCWDFGDPFEDRADIPPAWLIGKVSGPSIRNGDPSGGLYNREMPLSQQEVERIREALSYIGCEDHEDWLRVGMALRSTGARNQALSIWAEWSQSSPKWDEREAVKRWNSFREFRHDGSEIKLGTLFAMARERGWMGDEPMKFEPPIQEALPEEPTVPAEPQEPEEVEEGEKAEPFPEELMNFPGAVSDLASACLRFGRHSPHKSLAFGSALALISAVLNRRVKDEDDLMTQLYIALIAVTGAGKDANLKFPNEVLSKSNVQRVKDRAGPSGYTSEAAFRSYLSQKPATIMARDEAGKWIAQMMSDRASGADQSALAFILSLYSTNYGQVLSGTQYANEKERPTIDLYFPSVSIIGASTPEGFYAGGGVRANEDGFANRFIVVHADDAAPAPLTPQKMSQCLTMGQAVEVVEQMDSFFGEVSMFPPSDGAGAPVEDVHVMRYTEGASEALYEIAERNRQRRMENDLASLERNALARQVVNTKKVALCFAAGQNLGNPVSVEAVMAADKFVTWAMNRSIYESQMHVGKSEFAVAQHQLLDGLRARGLKKFSRGDVQGMLRQKKPREIDELLKALGDAGDIGISLDATGNYEVL